mmetsp:Transcript_762/g.973  ORF Transcript_762/g.973 Transcript_762/m.973 type:complete len:285 (+) Transcript_762:54-908(+)
MSISAAREVLVLLSSGIAILIGLVLLVYLLLLVFDRYCCCCPWFQPITDSQEIRSFSGRICREARLIGITNEERRLILEKVLISESYSPTCNSSSDTAKSVGDVDETVGDQNCEEEAEKGEMSAMSEYNESVCAICISDYEKGNTVIHGTSCVHVFHKECLLEWLEKHDVCPTCRKDMMTASEMKNAAKVVLCEERMDEITSAWVNNVPIPRVEDTEERVDNDIEMAELGHSPTDSTDQQEDGTQQSEESLRSEESPQNEESPQSETPFQREAVLQTELSSTTD